MNFLGLDYGQRHIGVAIATGPLAEPLTTIPTESALQLIKEFIQKHNVGAIVVGDVDASAQETLAQLGVQIYKTDETLSSHDARQALLFTSQKRRRVGEHAAAAAIILQSWLDSPNQTR